MAQMKIVCPGDRLACQDTHEAGSGTYVHNGWIYASTVGVLQEQPSVAGAGQKSKVEVQTSAQRPAVPKIGDRVTVKVMKVGSTSAHARILCVGSQALEMEFKGVIRSQDVRTFELDKVVMYDCFRPGDIVLAEVLSLGDARSYFLTTAKNELGVVHAKSLAGATMEPVSWQEMICPETKVVEKRKVAKVASMEVA